MATKKNKTKKLKDPFFRMKYIGYCWSETPAGDAPLELDDLVNFAKFQLCIATSRLMKDPIWDTYKTEDILVEFFARKFQKDKNFLKEFQLSIAGDEVNDFSSWADKMISMENHDREDKLKTLQDRISFNPGDVMGG